MTNTPRLRDSNIEALTPLASPRQICSDLPLSEIGRQTVMKSRRDIAEIIAGRDRRLLVVVGPCSIHDVTAGREYALRLATLQSELRTKLLLVMRVYFEKPRTTIGWKGLINDPHLNGSFEIELGIRQARRFLIELTELNLATATEALDPIIPQYLGDLIAWYAIGARTTESQTHREMASGLSAPCGFKNATDGRIDIAVNAIKSATHAHHFLGIAEDGGTAVIRTRGNTYSHLILRGGKEPNYDSQHVEAAVAALKSAQLPNAIVVDCSHGNSNKDPANQATVARSCIRQRKAGQHALVGLMLESHLHAGNQPLLTNPKDMQYGVSITDPCLDWSTTEALLREIART